MTRNTPSSKCKTEFLKEESEIDDYEDKENQPLQNMKNLKQNGIDKETIKRVANQIAASRIPLKRKIHQLNVSARPKPMPASNLDALIVSDDLEDEEEGLPSYGHKLPQQSVGKRAFRNGCPSHAKSLRM